WRAGRIGDHLLDERLQRNRAEWRFFGRLPDDRVAANEADHSVPGPHGHGKIECRYHADWTQRMPIFGQAMSGPLAGDRSTKKLTAESDGVIANVDDFLNFAESFGPNFSGFP